jgi:hypothetical protein
MSLIGLGTENLESNLALPQSQYAVYLAVGIFINAPTGHH